MGDEKKDIMREYLSSLNIPPDIAEIYITLKLNGPQTLSALSRLTRIERTKLYKLIDGMLDSNLFEIETESKRNLVSAAPIENLQILVQKKIDEVFKNDIELSRYDKATKTYLINWLYGRIKT